MRKAFHGRSGLHPKMLPQGLKCLARQMMAANGGVILRISGSNQCNRKRTKTHALLRLALCALHGRIPAVVAVCEPPAKNNFLMSRDRNHLVDDAVGSIGQ